MKTILDESTRAELILRINSLDENAKAKWGKMNVYQMLKHCGKGNDMMFGKLQIKQVFLGKLFGKLALKNVLKNDKVFRKNSPTAAELIIKEKEGDFAKQKTEWIKSIGEYKYYDNPNFVHPFFGTMTKEQVGQFVYKHYDHHLRQFGV